MVPFFHYLIPAIEHWLPVLHYRHESFFINILPDRVKHHTSSLHQPDDNIINEFTPAAPLQCLQYTCTYVCIYTIWQ